MIALLNPLQEENKKITPLSLNLSILTLCFTDALEGEECVCKRFMWELRSGHCK